MDLRSDARPTLKHLQVLVNAEMESIFSAPGHPRYAYLRSMNSLMQEEKQQRKVEKQNEVNDG